MSVHKAEIVYISKNGKYAAIPVIIENSNSSVLVFFPKQNNHKKGEIIDIPDNLKVVFKTKEDGGIFYFFTEGVCNFIIAPKIKNSFREDDYDIYDDIKIDYYNENNDICEYCGQYGCDCQRVLDEQDNY